MSPLDPHQADLEYHQPGLEVAHYDCPEPVPSYAFAVLDSQDSQLKGKHAHSTYPASGSSATPIVTQTPAPRRSRRRCWIIVATIAVILVTAAIVVPLTLFFTRKTDNSTSSQASTGSGTDVVPSPSPVVSAHGAMNGAGIALVRQDDADNTRRMIFQHASGELRQSSWGVSWTGGTNSSSDVVLPSGARNATPLAATSWNTNSGLYWRVVYVDQNNTLQDLVQAGIHQPWQMGSLGRSNFKVLNDPGAALSLIAGSNWTSDKPNGPKGDLLMGKDGGFKLYWPGEDGLLHEATLDANDLAWSETFKFDDSIDTKSGFQVWVSTSVHQLWVVNKANSYLAQYSVDYDPTTSKPGQWELSRTSKISAAPGSSIAYTNKFLLFYQDTQRFVQCVNVSHFATDSTWVQAGPVGGNSVTSAPGSKIAGSANGDKIELFMSTDGSNITQWVGPFSSLQWSRNAVPVGE